MPDWITHLAFAFVIASALRLTWRARTVFFIGNVMPDFFRLLVVFFEFALPVPALMKFVVFPLNQASHSLIAVVALAGIISIFFKGSVESHAPPVLGRESEAMQGKIKRAWRKLSGNVFFLLFIGGVCHLLLDACMWPWAGTIRWFYPLDHAWLNWGFKLFWPDDRIALVVLLPLVALAVVFEIIIHLKRERSKAHRFVI